jgi:hypothetical protein
MKRARELGVETPLGSGLDWAGLDLGRLAGEKSFFDSP